MAAAMAWATPTAILSALYFLAGFQMRLQGQMINPYHRSIGFSGSQISTITASSRVTGMLSPLLIGWLPNTVMAANVFVGIVYLLTAPLLLVRWGFPSFWPIFAAKCLLGTLGVVFSWTNVVVFTHANASFPRIRMYNAVGCLIGSLLLSYYLRWREASIPPGDRCTTAGPSFCAFLTMLLFFLFALSCLRIEHALSRVLAEPQMGGAILAVATGLFCLFFLPHTPPPAASTSSSKGGRFKARVKSARAVMGKQLKVEGFRSLLALCASIAFVREFVNQYSLVAMGEAAGMPPSSVNLAMGVWQVAEMLVASQLQGVIQRIGPRGAICLGLLAEALREVLCAYAGSVGVTVLVAGQSLGGVSMALYDSTLAMEGNRLRHASKDRGTPQLMLKTAEAVSLAGTLLAGWMWDACGPGGYFGPAAEPVGGWMGFLRAVGFPASPGLGAAVHRNWAAFFLPPAAARALLLVAFWLAYHPRVGGFVDPKPSRAPPPAFSKPPPPVASSPTSSPRSATKRVTRSTPRKTYGR